MQDMQMFIKPTLIHSTQMFTGATIAIAFSSSD